MEEYTYTIKKAYIKVKEKNIFKRIFRFFFPKYIEITDWEDVLLGDSKESEE